MKKGDNIYRIHQITLRIGEEKSEIPKKILKKLGRRDIAIGSWEIVRESIDARDKPDIRWVYSVDFSVLDSGGKEGGAGKMNKVEKAGKTGEPDRAGKKMKLPLGGKAKLEEGGTEEYSPPKPSAAATPAVGRPVIVGFGPAGIFAALILAQAGYRPLVVERGRDVERRQRDVELFWSDGVLDENSNVQFGEGGAGTFSDGKLTTGIKDVRIRKVLEELVKAGAPKDILYKQKPHVGTDILRRVVAAMREEIKRLGGEVLFGRKAVGMVVEDGAVKALKVQCVETGEALTVECFAAVFAVGHSSRDTFRWLLEQGVSMKQKPFSMGVRIEHPQDVIDIAQYGRPARELGLPVADYKVNHRCENGRGVYTFCMCPGGEVIISSSQAGGVVTNGMSYHDRDSGMANSALLCDVRTEDFGSKHALAGVEFQEKYEGLAFELGGGGYRAPVTTWGALRDGNAEAAAVEGCLPPFVLDAFREAMPQLGRKIKGFDDEDAKITAVEARSSSPVRFARNEAFEGAMTDYDGRELTVKGFYPCGEGAGYAGGITSAAVDGIRVAEAIVKGYLPVER